MWSNSRTVLTLLLVTVVVTAPVTAENQPPNASTGPDRDVIEGTTAELDASNSTDPDGDALGYNWTVVAGTGVNLSDADTATPTFTAPNVSRDVVRIVRLEVIVRDANGSVDTDTVNITIEPKQPPTPNDPDSDGLYEDVDGDGDVDLRDAFVLAFDYALNSDLLNDEQVAALDFDGDGAVDLDDVFVLAFE
jgi:hypothetical protein